MLDDATGEYKLNDKILDPEAFYGTYYWDYLSRSTFDATYVKLREASLTYNFPKKILGRLPISNLNLSLIARNLFTWTSADMGYDPETAMTLSNGGLARAWAAGLCLTPVLSEPSSDSISKLKIQRSCLAYPLNTSPLFLPC